MKRPDMHEILMYSYACGLERHNKHTRTLIEYIEHLEERVEALRKEADNGARIRNH